MAKKTKSAKGKHPRKLPKKAAKKPKQTSVAKASPRPPPKAADGKPETRTPIGPNPSAASNIQKESPIFSIELEKISGETTIGDLIVAFPRTRSVLMKQGLSFGVEDAGYIYMTLNVFSALHGLTVNSLITELVAASKELPSPPTTQPIPQIATPPST